MTKSIQFFSLLSILILTPLFSRANWPVLTSTDTAEGALMQLRVSANSGGSVDSLGGLFPEGESVTLNATALPGFSFLTWQGDVQSTETL